MSEVEIDQYIAQLKTDLDVVGRKAKARFKRAKEKTLKLVGQRYT
jgi:hypothetical protein